MTTSVGSMMRRPSDPATAASYRASASVPGVVRRKGPGTANGLSAAERHHGTRTLIEAGADGAGGSLVAPLISLAMIAAGLTHFWRRTKRRDQPSDRRFDRP